MPKMNGTGPEGKGLKTGRGLGRCAKETSGDVSGKLGKNRGKKFKSGVGQGLGKRFQSGLK